MNYDDWQPDLTQEELEEIWEDSKVQAHNFIMEIYAQIFWGFVIIVFTVGLVSFLAWIFTSWGS